MSRDERSLSSRNDEMQACEGQWDARDLKSLRGCIGQPGN